MDQIYADIAARTGGNIYVGVVGPVRTGKSTLIKRIMEEQGRGKVILAFTSGGPIAAAMQHVLSLSPEAAIRLNWQVINASYTKFMYNDKRITLAGFNCSSHLDLHADRLRLVSYR